MNVKNITKFHDMINHVISNANFKRILYQYLINICQMKNVNRLLMRFQKMVSIYIILSSILHNFISTGTKCKERNIYSKKIMTGRYFKMIHTEKDILNLRERKKMSNTLKKKLKINFNCHNILGTNSKLVSKSLWQN